MEKSAFLVLLDEVVKVGNFRKVESWVFWKTITYYYAHIDFYMQHFTTEEDFKSAICYLERLGNIKIDL